MTAPQATNQVGTRATEETAERPESSSGPESGTRTALIWSYALTIGRFATTACVVIVMAPFLDPRAYGVMALAVVWVTFAQLLALHGPAQAVIQRGDVTDRHFDAAFWVTLGISVVEAVIFAAAAPLWAALNSTPELVVVCWALAPAIVLNALVVVPDSILRRNMQFKKLSIRVLIAGLASGVAGIVVALAGYGVWALVVQQLILTGISAVAVWAAVRWRPRLRSTGPALRDIRAFSLHSISGFLANFLSTRIDALLLGIFFGPVAVGLYRFAVRFTDTISEVAVGGLGQISLPHLSRLGANTAAFAERLGRIVHIAAVLAFPVFGVLASVAEPLLASIGRQWVGAAPALEVLCVAGVFGAVGAIVGAALQAAGRPGMSAAVGWIMAAVTAVTITLIGAKFASADAVTQVFAIAVTFCAIQAAFVTGSVVIIFRVVLRVPMIPALLPAVPAMLSAVAAAIVGLTMQRLLFGTRPLIELAITGASAGAAAAAVLLTCDSDVSSYVRRLLGRAVVGRRR